jgi:hypothetical protein
VNLDYPEHGNPPIRSALIYPPCTCRRCVLAADPKRNLRALADDRSYSPTMQRLRPLITQANKWAHAGWF